jgi:hypothetical protein
MSDHGTVSNEMPGWYIQLQTDVLLQLPRPGEISEKIALGWHDNRGAMKKALREALLPPGKPASAEAAAAPQPHRMSIVVDCDANPRTLSGLSLTGEGTEHRKMGKITLVKREGKLYANGKMVIRHLSPNQRGGKVIEGHKLRNELKDVQVLNACTLDALLANPLLIPEAWESGHTYFWGTIFRGMGGRLYVKYLYCDGGRWYWHYHWLGRHWDKDYPAASLAS